jgi:hypothetical protein
MKMHTDIEALKGSTVTLGPILTDLGDAHARHISRCIDAAPIANIERSSLNLLHSEQRTILANARCTPGFFNAVMRSRVGSKWVDRNAEWAVVDEEG